MIKDEEIAKYISDVGLKINSNLNDSIFKIEKQLSEDELRAYKFSVGKVMMSVFDDILAPLYEEHPKLKPQGYD